MSIPEIRDLNGFPTLFVKDEPFFCLSGELHNSSTSSAEYMEEEVWPKLEGLHMNSVIAPVYWECIEETEGVYDFSLVDSLILQARQHGMHLILLWFGLWKNGGSMYVPGWMKKDSETYFLARSVKGEPIPTVSPLCDAAVEKDAACFRRLMRHIREFDEKESTVIVMQVENEIGILRSARDCCDAANTAFAEEVPAVIAEKLGVHGTWREAFGDKANESFMAYQFAQAVERIASAGREEYPLPCYANAWLYQYPWYPGSYPVGGPVVQVQPVWKAAAPSLFGFGPDIYVPYVADVMDEYTTNGNPLFIPEVRKDAVASSYCLYAFGAKNAICFSPFGIEDLGMDPSEIEKPSMELIQALNIDPTSLDITGSREHLAAAYSFISEIKPLLLQYRGTDKLKAFCRHGETDYGTVLEFGEYNILASYAPRASAKPLGAGIIIEEAPDTFLICGMMSGIRFMPKDDEKCNVDLLRMEEGCIRDGKWVPGRVLNGDEKLGLKLGEHLSCLKVKVYKY